MVENCIIIGAGDVVAKRLLPALLSANFADNYLILHNGKNDTKRYERDYPQIVSSEMRPAKIEKCLMNSAPTAVFVATPPGPRPILCEAALSVGHLVIAEKPLAVTKEGIATFRAMGEDANRLFALSYYALEKALPWTSLHAPCTQRDELLKLPPGISMDQIRAARHRMGPLQNLNINICEGMEHEASSGERYWYQDDPHGVWFDMGVHVLMLAIISGVKPDTLRGVGIRNLSSGQYELKYSKEGVQFTSRFGKHFQQIELDRSLSATFLNGTAQCDFNLANCSLVNSQNDFVEFSNALRAPKYGILVRQIVDFIEAGGWGSISDRRDLFTTQIEALTLLLELNKRRT